MAAKFDAQVLKKNLFWILLGIAALFELVLLVILPLSDPGADKRKDYEDTLKTTKGLTGGFKNEKFLPSWETRKGEYEKEKNTTWAKAWNPQGGDPLNTIYYSPPGMKPLIYPTDDIPGSIRTDYKNKYYNGQFKNFEAEIQETKFLLNSKDSADWRILQGPTPITFGAGTGGGAAPAAAGGGMMGMGGGKPGGGGLAGAPDAGGPGGAAGGGAKVATGPGLRGLLEERISFDLDPNREEIWILQEDLSVRREVVRLFREALAEIGNMRRVASPSNEPKAIVLANAYWKLKLVPGTQGRIDASSTLENVHAQHRPQPLYDKAAGWSTRFMIAQPNQPPVEIKLEGDPVMYREVRSFKDFPPMNIGTIDLTKPFTVCQFFDPANCPIRRIEKVALGRGGQSHRTMEAELKPRNTLPAEKPAEGEGDAAAAGGGAGGEGMGAMMPAGMGGMMMGGGGPGGPGGGAPVGDPTMNNKIDRLQRTVPAPSGRNQCGGGPSRGSHRPHLDRQLPHADANHPGGLGPPVWYGRWPGRPDWRHGWHARHGRDARHGWPAGDGRRQGRRDARHGWRTRWAGRISRWRARNGRPGGHARYGWNPRPGWRSRWRNGEHGACSRTATDRSNGGSGGLCDRLVVRAIPTKTTDCRGW
ncbi:MAG: hypothetical protein LW700_02905 [Gemmataceae bacterium]|nr:hypothetical protein [Gemmataceae bacterium]